MPIPVAQLALITIMMFYSINCRSHLAVLLFICLLILLINNYGKIVFVKVCLVLTFFAFYFLVNSHISAYKFKHQPKVIYHIRLIPDSININGDLLSFEGEENENRYQIFYQLKTKEEFLFYRNCSDYLDIETEIKLEHADGQRNFNGFNYQKYLKNHGIFRIGRLKDIKKMRISKVRNLFEHLVKWRRLAIVTCQQTYPDPMAHYMTGLLFGFLDKSFGQMTDIYSQLGIIHLFALSGMHVGFFFNNFRKVLIKISIPQEYFPGIELLFSIFYAAITGYSISVLRSLSQRNLSNLKVSKEDNIAFTVFILFVFSPNFLLTVGGVLSLAYAFVISILNNRYHHHKCRQFIFPLSIACAGLPFLTFYFSVYHPISILLTALFSLLFDQLILPLLTVVYFLTPILPLRTLNGIFESMEVVVRWLCEKFGHAWIIGKPNQIQLFLILALLVILYDFWNRKNVRYLLIFLLSLVWFSIAQPFKNEITIVDVGQGDSILIRDIFNKTILIDVGGVHKQQGKMEWQRRHNLSNAEKTLIPYLKSQGINKIDQLLLTHTDTDHVGDMEDVVKSINIKEILVSQGSLTNQEFVDRLYKMKRKVKVIKRGDVLPVMGSQLRVLYPFKKGDGKNNDSIVLYGKLLNKRFLFTGDLEADGEKEILGNYPDLKADILKAGHHGSKGSSIEEFIDQLSPQIALFSAGKNNIYKHPHQETISRFHRRKINTLRTDQNGAIRFKGLFKWTIECVNP